ncbi:MAG: glutamine synthetase III [Leptolyngbya sp.]|nr:glutamine synthetase III [Candidatus Melainabacteria bacterium]
MSYTIYNTDKRSKFQVSKGNGNGFALGRKKAVSAVNDREPLPGNVDYRLPITDIYGSNVFNRQTMRTLLPKNVYKAVLRCLDHGEQLDPNMADTVANAMKDWAISRGATHFTHWFVPLHGYTAEKHDSFLSTFGEDGAVLEFSGKNLVQGEPDASSFPSGGIRSTFEARGYTGWDPSSPAFIMDSVNGKTLCIPSVFCSFSGHALDVKTPLLRSLEAINKSAVRLLNTIGKKDVKRVACTVGPEQEYFLIDEAFYLARPDIINAGRALFGARPPKGQEMEDHYWGSIRERVLAFMMDAEHELYRLGVPVKTRHNEVAPAQFEVAPFFENSNLATDHNMLLMEVFKKTAQKHGFRCLFHEKPFSGINGSGKHNNWSMADDQGNNLLEPGEDAQNNTTFLVVLSAVIRSLDKYSKLLRASIATAGNDHRLGANEAPPAIMSIYLGDALTKVIDNLISGKAGDAKKAGELMKSGVSMLPEILKDDSDRNRTSPFAFTGNKFEFRAVGSSQSVAMPNTVLNTMVAESMDFLSDEIEKESRKSGDLQGAISLVTIKALSDHKRVLFNGDNYSKEWHEEASRRGLSNLRNLPEALPALIETESKELFERYGVFKEDELVSRYHILLENYCKVINIESLLTSSMATTMILPAAIEYQTRLATAIVQTKSAISGVTLTHQEKMLNDVSEKINNLTAAIENLAVLHLEQRVDEHEDEASAEAKFYQTRVIPAMNEVRNAADELELIVDDSLWPLPKFREMLYIY